MRDIWTTLQQRIRTAGAQPLVTYVDPAGGERTELSAVSLGNAAAKIANALREEFELEPGDRVVLDLPLHWQRATWCAGAWTASCIVQSSIEDARLVVTTPTRAAGLPSLTVPVVAVSLHPFGLPITETLPDGVDDVTLAVRQQPDAYLFEPPSAASPALQLDGVLLSQAQLLDAGRDLAAQCGLGEGGRLLVGNQTSVADQWIGTLPAPLSVGASVVLLGSGSDADGVIARQEEVTAHCSSPVT